jgi:hypothetical protein
MVWETLAMKRLNLLVSRQIQAKPYGRFCRLGQPDSVIHLMQVTLHLQEITFLMSPDILAEKGPY